MAGIGFKLRHMINKESYTGFIRAYGYSGFVGSGTWLISTAGILFIIFGIHAGKFQELYITQFLISVTAMISLSMILSSFAQHNYARYIADCIFENSVSSLLASLRSICLVITASFGILIYFASDFLFSHESELYRILFCAGFVVLANIWPSISLLASLKKHKEMMICFLLGYLLTIILAYLLKSSQLAGLMFSFFMGQFLIFLLLMIVSIRNFFSDTLITMDYFTKQRTHVYLILISLFFNLGVWADKYIFWYFSQTSQSVIGVLRASTIYDLPMFIAFMTIIPGFAVFFFRIESDFAIYYDYYYRAVREGGTFYEILEKRDQLVQKSKDCIMDIMKIQSIVVLFVFLFGEQILNHFRLPEMHYYLLRIDCVSTMFLMILIATINMLLYLDKQKEALKTCLLFCVSNILLTALSLKLGMFYYGYGFCVSLFLSCVAGFIYLDKKYKRLEFETFMYRG